MKLETASLILTEINESHVEDILRIRSNEVINRFVNRSSPKSNYEALEFILEIKRKTEDKEIVFWGISYKGHRNLIGTICLWNFSGDKKIAEAGYELLPDYHKKGIMTEALAAVLDFGFNTLNLQEILAFTNQMNRSSHALLLKHKFAVDDNIRDEKNSGNVIFSLKKSQYQISNL
ncbi:GNAT family N-acetyltransferase [Chryseobacterium flavum]|uniref:GNAT family N-acetyltransferase n=1 Tax=Chryseobacterium flavum TaxID=415851 RepID=UPI0028B0A2CF|nr:GNAT family N-acetyltransferase [Chryseobacterium flavum]